MVAENISVWPFQKKKKKKKKKKKDWLMTRVINDN